MLDLADREPVRRRFRLDDDDLARLERVGRAERHPLGPGRRAPRRRSGSRRFDAGTWRTGVDRLLVGVTMTEDGSRLFAGVLPLDDVESGAIDLAGRFAELVDRLARAPSTRSPTRKPVDAWAAAIADAADALTDPAPRDAWQRAELQRILDDVVDEARTAPTTRRSRSPRSAPCSPSACRAARRGPTSAPAT